MNQESERHLARNEALFRETNEAIERGQWPDHPDKLVRFRCECSQLECDRAIEVTLGEYEQVRQFPRRFILSPGHEIAKIEMIVDFGKNHVVVEKTDQAGVTAEAADPRQ